MNAPAAAGMGSTCDTIYRIARKDEFDDQPYLLRCKDEAVARVVICQDGRKLTVKRCAGCLNLLQAQAKVGRVAIESEQAL